MIKTRKMITIFVFVVVVILIFVSYNLVDVRLIAGRNENGTFFYSDEFSGGVEDTLSFGMASLIFAPLAMLLGVTVIKNREFGKLRDLFLMFITITIQILVIYEWNDKANILLNSFYGVLQIRIWFICILILILYLLILTTHKIINTKNSVITDTQFRRDIKGGT